MCMKMQCFSLTAPEILLHPFFQLFGDLLFLPLFDICDKHSRVKGALTWVDAQVFHFLFSVVQEAHVGCLRDKLRKHHILANKMNSNYLSYNLKSQKLYM
ncbi:hypothetical protein XENORESO_017852 [Xenotaenia resolanae]|uniref:Uncharacterized protein n=1 Tax=Xenotaenia resolanae TaxID=208358 RepID=A0ABV0X944_9TELE